MTYKTLFDVSYKKEEPEGRENWVRVGRAFMSHEGVVTVRFDSLPIPAFWPSHKLVLYPKELSGHDEVPEAPAPSPPDQGSLVQLKDVPRGSFFRRPKGRTAYMRITNFAVRDAAYGVSRGGSVLKMNDTDPVVIVALGDFLAEGPS